MPCCSAQPVPEHGARRAAVSGGRRVKCTGLAASSHPDLDDVRVALQVEHDLHLPPHAVHHFLIPAGTEGEGEACRAQHAHAGRQTDISSRKAYIHAGLYSR